MAEWTENDRAAVAAGGTSIAELAAARGVSRQAVHAAFKRRGWSTKPAEPGMVASDALEPVREREKEAAVAAHPNDDQALAGATGASAPICLWPEEPADLAELVRLRALNVAALALTHAERILSGPHIGPAALKSTVQAAEIAFGRFEQLVADHAADPPTMTIIEMSADRAAEIRRKASQEFHGEFGDDEEGPAPDLDDDPGSLDETAPPSPPEARHDTPETMGGTTLHAEPDGAPGAFQAPSPAELQTLAERLDAAASDLGRVWLRAQIVALGLQPSHDKSSMICTLLDAAAQDRAILGQLDLELSRRAI